MSAACGHEKFADVTLSDGVTVANLCVDCDARLPADWGCTDCEYEAMLTPWGSKAPARRIVSTPCPKHDPLTARARRANPPDSPRPGS